VAEVPFLKIRYFIVSFCDCNTSRCACGANYLLWKVRLFLTKLYPWCSNLCENENNCTFFR